MVYFLLFIFLYVLVIYPLLKYNTFVYNKNRVKTSFSSVDVLLKKRYDLIPNLVDIVKAYALHEKKVLEKITFLRKQGINNPDIKLQDEISNSLKNIFLLAENYPDLKANQNFLYLQETLKDIENQISASRRAFNAMVNEYNTSIESFPASIIAKVFKFESTDFFKLSVKERKNINVSFEK